jgi:hypothetical protein
MTDIEITEISPEQMARDFEATTPEMVERAKRFREVWEEYQGQFGRFSQEAYEYAATDMGMTSDEAYALLSRVSNADFYKQYHAN